MLSMLFPSSIAAVVKPCCSCRACRSNMPPAEDGCACCAGSFWFLSTLVSPTYRFCDWFCLNDELSFLLLLLLLFKWVACGPPFWGKGCCWALAPPPPGLCCWDAFGGRFRTNSPEGVMSKSAGRMDGWSCTCRFSSRKESYNVWWIHCDEL